MNYFKRILALALAAAIAVQPVSAYAASDKFTELDTDISLSVRAEGAYSNWEGVSNVSQFVDSKGNYCYAYDGSKKITVICIKNGKKASSVKLSRKHPIFGAVTCDAEGNYYVVTGDTNSTTDTSKNTVFVSKYNKNGTHIKTVGDNGSSSLGYWYDSSFYTQQPFSGGNCDVAINGNYLVVNYARKMYSGHQSNSVFAIDINTMKKISVGLNYNSHSFAQRVIPLGDHFLLASEGDCYSRAFTVSVASAESAAPDAQADPTAETSGVCRNYDIFRFWVPKGTLDSYDMYILNDNFAHMGGIAVADKNHAALVGTSAKALSSKAQKQTEQLFIQVFNPDSDLTQESAYYTSGTRTGYSGGNGDEKVTDYGVKWLTSASYTICSPQVTVDSKGRYIIFFEKYVNEEYKGVFYEILNKKGKVVRKITKYSSEAHLNPCETPVCIGTTVYWTANRNNSDKMIVFQLKAES